MKNSPSPKMDLKDFLPHVKSKFSINKIEPWSEHFRSLDAKYLDDLRAAQFSRNPAARS